MSRRTAEASKAVALAWANEQQRVKEGKGTRDWTPDQQRDILERGKAYDENGRAFEGQHMKSVEKYPEYQGDPDNIQFLTKEEHLAAHQGNWQNPTNWYYNPVTKEYLDFGDGSYIPCTVIDLSEPIMIEPVPNQKSDNGGNEPEINNIPEPPQPEKREIPNNNKETVPKKMSIPIKLKKPISKIWNRLAYVTEKVIKFPVEHPMLTAVVVGIGKVAIDQVTGGGGSGSSTPTNGGGSSSSSSTIGGNSGGISSSKNAGDSLGENDDNLEDDITNASESEDAVNEPSDDCSSEEKTPQTKCPHETKGYKRIRNGKEETVRGYVTGQNRKKSDDN